LALSLEHSGLKVAVIEGQMPDPELPDIPENRVSAINLASETLLRSLDAWPSQTERVGPYQQMEVWEADSSARIEFSAELMQASHLGHIIENRLLQLSLLAQA